MTIVDDILKVRRPAPRFPVLSTIAQRFSPRVINGSPIPKEHLQSILEAARLTPSARFHQPWFFYVIKKDSAAFGKLKLCIPERNGWALNASLIIVACYIPNDPQGIQNKWAQYDLGAAVLSLVLQAQDLGYYSRQIGSFSPEETKKQFSIEEHQIPFTLIAMGKLGTDKDYSTADKEYVEKDLIPPGHKEIIYKEMK